MDAARLPRITDRLAPEARDAIVSWRITGTADVAGRPALEVRLDGEVPLLCQRCLAPFSWPVAQSTLLLLARDERELDRLDAEDEHEVMLAAEAIDTATLTEDELLLSLPFVPRCGRAECADSPIGAAGASESGARSSAFAALEGLQSEKSKKSGKD
ncbi:MAG: YceD family protein [Betaproteobacteria bacterium]